MGNHPRAIANDDGFVGGGQDGAGEPLGLLGHGRLVALADIREGDGDASDKAEMNWRTGQQQAALDASGPKMNLGGLPSLQRFRQQPSKNGLVEGVQQVQHGRACKGAGVGIQQFVKRLVGVEQLALRIERGGAGLHRLHESTIRFTAFEREDLLARGALDDQGVDLAVADGPERLFGLVQTGLEFIPGQRRYERHHRHHSSTDR